MTDVQALRYLSRLSQLHQHIFVHSTDHESSPEEPLVIEQIEHDRVGGHSYCASQIISIVTRSRKTTTQHLL